MYVCMYVFMYVCMYLCYAMLCYAMVWYGMVRYVCMCVCVCVYVCVCVCVCVSAGVGVDHVRDEVSTWQVVSEVAITLKLQQNSCPWTVQKQQVTYK